MAGDRGYELVEYAGGVRIPRIEIPGVGGIGPFRLGAKERVIRNNQGILRRLTNEFGDTSALLAVVERGSIRVTTASDATYDNQGGRLVPIDPRLKQDRDLGGRIGIRSMQRP